MVTYYRFRQRRERKWCWPRRRKGWRVCQSFYWLLMRTHTGYHGQTPNYTVNIYTIKINYGISKSKFQVYVLALVDSVHLFHTTIMTFHFLVTFAFYHEFFVCLSNPWDTWMIPLTFLWQVSRPRHGSVATEMKWIILCMGNFISYLMYVSNR